ncbi:serine/threonine-protein phosphatase CPPED1-like [Cimex lectularius]|uniref:Calcineurin-like phosphoesterase domain-containing protein n=1 Tax=Cimex lectularius TaxID=79782 RepID=A0A8I6S4P3_CIMLE|nr:serine/threonine-protein phosphatase CPPED1-like [Cimex lectularius]
MQSLDETNRKVINEYKKFNEEDEKTWKGPFYFVQGADCQFGLIARYLEKKETPNWDKEIALSKKCVELINSLEPKPKFFVICGDLADAYPEPGTATIREKQVIDFHKIFGRVDKSIPVVCLCGNHDVGEQPTIEAVSTYKSDFGDDYFSFWAGGVLFICLNSQYFVDGSKILDLVKSQNEWLDEQLELSKNSKNGAVIFQHIAPFIDDPECEDTYFCLKRSVRKSLMDKWLKAGVRYVFCGHCHHNAGGMYKSLECIITTAIGGQIGGDSAGFRIVKVYDNSIKHDYYAFENVPKSVKL